MIKSFRCAATQGLFNDRLSRRFRGITRAAQRKLEMLEAAEKLDDLRVPPGNRLEALHGDRAGQHSIRINDQWRICFRWRDDAAHEVEIVDYHQHGRVVTEKGKDMTKLLDPVTPGEILLEEFMKPMGISQNKLARDIDVSVARINDIVHARRGVTADTALRLGKYFGISAEFWLNLQARYDLKIARRNVWPSIEKNIRSIQVA